MESTPENQKETPKEAFVKGKNDSIENNFDAKMNHFHYTILFREILDKNMPNNKNECKK